MQARRTTVSPRWGKVEIIVNSRARRIIMRALPDVLRITVPPGATDNDIQAALEKHGDTLKERQQTTPRRFIDKQFRIVSDNMTFSIREHDSGKFAILYKGTEATLLCPEATDYTTKQEWLRLATKKAMAGIAGKILPARLQAIAAQHGLVYSRCQVRDTHTRWGSCSSKGNISLSIYLIILPDRLIDYVLKHELCHTVHMNHGTGFWRLLDKLCGTNAKSLRAELKKFRTDI